MRFDERIVKSVGVVVLLLASVAGGLAQEECATRITLLQVNDVYQFAPVDRGTRGGIGRVLTLKKQIQKESPNTLFLFSGDTISPSVESITYKGAQMIEAWNTVGLDYATFGNHEFDFGPEVLQERIKESRFGWVAANVVDKNRTALWWRACIRHSRVGWRKDWNHWTGAAGNENDFAARCGC